MSSIISAFQAKSLTINKKNEWVNDFMDRIYNESIKRAIEDGRFFTTYTHHHPIPQEVIDGLVKLGYTVEVPERLKLGGEDDETHEDVWKKHDTGPCNHHVSGSRFSITIKW